MVDLIPALSAISHGLDILKKLNEADRSLDTATLKLQIAELSNALAAAQIALSQSQQELQTKDARIASLLKNFERSTETIRYHGHLYEKAPDGSKQGNPFCPLCFQKEGALMLTTNFGKGISNVKCPNCKSEFHGVDIYFYLDEPSSPS